MKIGPKYKICKRVGSAIFEKCQTKKFAAAQGKRGVKRKGGARPRAISEYGKQLLEKQKVRYTYGLTEKQMARYVKEAVRRRKGIDPSRNLFEKLESRLDNAVYRSGVALTRRMARQMVSHGHITVNGKKVTIPSLSVSKGDEIRIREGSRKSTMFSSLSERLKEQSSPAWISFKPREMLGEIKNKPDYAGSEHLYDLGLVLEFYSR
jgi:small subunit ribosomal protein S4